MSHHAYFIAGEAASANQAAQKFAHEQGGEIVFLSYGLFSVEDSRKLIDIAHRSGDSGGKIIIVQTTRFFHEAQNALLKVLEEPPEGVTIILIVPSVGMLLPTVRSRLLPLPNGIPGKEEKRRVKAGGENEKALPEIAQQFLASTQQEREKLTSKLVEAAKSDKDEVKQHARHQALELIQGLTQKAYALEKSLPTSPKSVHEHEELRLLLEDLAVFMPLMYERSAPLKLIFEHLLITMPKTLAQA